MRRPPPLLRILGGFFFILAGVFAYYRVALGFSLPLIFVGAGAAVLIIAVAGHRASGGDIAIFIIGLLVLGGVASNLAVGGNTKTLVYSATNDQVSAHKLVLNASTNFGSIDVDFSNRRDLAYQVNFTASTPFFFFPTSIGQPFFSNQTVNDALLLDARSGGQNIRVIIWEGYLTNITVSTGGGSINLETLGTEKLGTVTLFTGAGSINAVVTVASIDRLEMSTGGGSVNLRSDHLAPATPHVPVSIYSGAGSVNINISVPRDAGVSISASTGVGTISQNLPGFSVTTSPGKLSASAGDLSGSSLDVSVSTGAGTLSLDARLL